MTVKEYLSQPMALMEEIRCDLDNLAALRSVVESVTTNLSFTAGCNPSKDPYAFENTMLNIQIEEEKIREKKKRLDAIIVDILENIRKLQNPRHQAVLRMRFLEGLSFRAIAARMDCGQTNAFKLQTAAIKELEKIVELS